MKRVNFLIFISVFLSFSILLEGCMATIISTPKKGVKIYSNPSEATVYVNNKKRGETPTKIRLRRNKNSEIRIEKEGYKTYNEIIYPAKMNPMAFIGVIWIVPYIVDIATGGAFKLNKKKINTNLIKFPSKVDTSQTVYCNEVNFKFKAGDKMGNIFLKNEPIELIYYGKTVDFSLFDFQEDINNSLKDLGFNILESGKSILTGKSRAKYTIVADVKDLKYDVIVADISPTVMSSVKSSKEQAETKCKIEVNWQLKDVNKQVIIEKTTKGESIKFEYGGNTAIYDALENSFYEFIYDGKFAETLKKLEEPKLTKINNEIKINKPNGYNIPKEKLINNATKSVVTIKTKFGHGSGCIISSDGYIVTNFHVIEGEKIVKVIFKDGSSFDGEVLRYDEEVDLALVKILGTNYSPLIISTDREINIGSDVYAIGTPQDEELSQTVSKGIISGERNVEGNVFIQTDVAVNAGCSGGALLDKYGIVVGIINAKMIGKGIEGIGYAIPAYRIFDILKIQY